MPKADGIAYTEWNIPSSFSSSRDETTGQRGKEGSSKEGELRKREKNIYREMMKLPIRIKSVKKK